MWMFLCKSLTHRVFNANVTYYTSVNERRNSDTNEAEVYVGERKLSGYSSYTTDTVVFNRTLWNMMTLNGNVIFDGQVVFDVPRMFVPKPSMFSSFIFYDTVSVGSVFKFFKHVSKRTPADILNTEMEVVSARGLEVELVDGIEEENQDLRELRRLVQLDGEMYSLETPSFQLWYKRDVVQIFTSYL